MVRRTRTFEVVLALVLTLAGLFAFASAGQLKHGALSIADAWARASLGKNPNSVAYLKITNSGTRADTLVAVRGDAAKAIEIHEHVHDGDIMRMRKVEGGVTIGAGASKTFMSGGHHIMLIGLKSPLKQGQEFPLTLVFESAGEVTVNVTVRLRAP